MKNDSFNYFFFDHLSKNINISEQSKIYLIHMFNKFLYTKNLYMQPDINLALLYKESIESSNLLNKKIFLNQIGDTSLFITGIFPDSFQRKTVSINYYKDMGKNAYLSLSEIENNSSLRETYVELCKSFDECVKCLNMISIKPSPNTLF